jgi:altronate hydrolase
MTTTNSTSVVVPLVPLDGVDDVGLVLEGVHRGTSLQLEGGDYPALQDIPVGHRVAVRAIAEGAPVHKYGEVIGIATQPIAPGAHVHTHNLGMGDHRPAIRVSPRRSASGPRRSFRGGWER